MNIFSRIREFVWPLLEKGPITPPTHLDVNEIEVDSPHLQKTLEYVIDCYNAESDRRKGIESKASLFIGTISVVTSVVLGVTSILVKENEFGIMVCALILLLFVLTLYMARTIWFSIQAVERKNYHSISVNDFLFKDSNDEYYKKLIAEFANKINKNVSTINSKVDSMTMAQEYFKRAIVTVVLYAFIILLLFISKSGVDFSFYLERFVDLVNNIHINGWNTLILYVLSGASIILSLVAIKRQKKK
ncbi:hypothetical protein [Proteiniphilum propionicum]|uniref:hypothetical protein n=1 Tax=Proteiniphilum propionicum TaxID=2829812 RepID=UPI001EEAF149|nr:hypothetical protein [Proteiniphilum propionicum]ULB35727.1 hypothetical protein KDN43_06805 [Proteiniphilum propionicum]